MPHPASEHLRGALRITYAAIVVSAIAGTVSISAGIMSASTGLIGTGADVIADLLSSVVLAWRFHAERSGRRTGQTAENHAHLAASLALLVVAAGVAASAIAHLASGQGASPAAGAVAVAAASLLVLPILAVIKLRVAAAVNSRALRTDALITVVGAATAALSLIGLILTRIWHQAAADPAAALAIAALAGWTGLRELRGRQQRTGGPAPGA